MGSLKTFYTECGVNVFMKPEMKRHDQVAGHTLGPARFTVFGAAIIAALIAIPFGLAIAFVDFLLLR